MKVLFVNACIRGEASRTAKLCRAALDEFAANWKGVQITEVDLGKEQPLPLNVEQLQKRGALVNARDFNDPIFDDAKTFVQADMIVVGAPYWDLSFPALLKIYLEQTCVNGIAFYYDDQGQVQSMCAAKKALYITTAGGFIGENNFGYEYVNGVFRHLFRIPRVDFASAEGLDIIGADVNKILSDGEQAVRAVIRSWK